MTVYDNYQSAAYAGMKGDAGDDRVESFPVGSAGLGLGLVSGSDANGYAVAGAGTQVRGLSLQSHTVTGDGYVTGDAASVMTSGLAWCQVADGVVTKDGAVYYTAAGKVTSTTTGNTLLAKAKFRSAITTVTDPLGTSTSLALVEVRFPAIG